MIKLTNKAFTLTELLMVVLMIGIISAMVLPKFTKVVDSFRALEAEQMMQTVRSKQEIRCTLGKKYTLDVNKVDAFPKKNNVSSSTYTTSNFTYTLNSKGISASSEKGHTLSMPSYLDGRICCDQCGSFTKNYLTCDELDTKEDFQAVQDNDECKAQS